MLDFNLAWLAARPIFETGLHARETFFQNLNELDRRRPSGQRMRVALSRLRSAMNAGSLDGIIRALAEVDAASIACEADGLPGRDFAINCFEAVEENGAADVDGASRDNGDEPGER